MGSCHGLTPGSTPTRPALSCALSSGSACSAPLIASAQAAPVSSFARVYGTVAVLSVIASMCFVLAALLWVLSHATL